MKNKKYLPFNFLYKIFLGLLFGVLLHYLSNKLLTTFIYGYYFNLNAGPGEPAYSNINDLMFYNHNIYYPFFYLSMFSFISFGLLIGHLILKQSIHILRITPFLFLFSLIISDMWIKVIIKPAKFCGAERLFALTSFYPIITIISFVLLFISAKAYSIFHNQQNFKTSREILLKLFNIKFY